MALGGIPEGALDSQRAVQPARRIRAKVRHDEEPRPPRRRRRLMLLGAERGQLRGLRLDQAEGVVERARRRARAAAERARAEQEQHAEQQQHRLAFVHRARVLHRRRDRSGHVQIHRAGALFIQ
jgi:hypothetical protein